MLLTVSVVAALGVAGGAHSSDPLAMAEKGQLQCYRPNIQDKTCLSIASYKRTGPGHYVNRALIPVSSNATLETNTPVVIKGDAVCGFVREQDTIAGTLRVDGQVVDTEKAKPILERITRAMTPMVRKEICTRYEPSGTGFTAKISVDGSYVPDLDEAVKWISPTDGYTVTP